ncbi:hypothetical protein [Cystobacter fuscus]|uniref:hypothetical protein n=1 Tax=Cystobacter fuscus TaxID=43 RepID=UPI0012DDA8B1|nr:hypothetical protein [Cystobacter fuscus]
MPNKEEIDQLFQALVVNGLEFIERSAGELEEDPKFSIAHFATGLELLLKARLFAEHWSLTASDPHACTWSGLKGGSVNTVQASALCSVITSKTGTSLQHSKDAFKAVFEHRNKALHWIPPGDTRQVAAEQCRAWYLLHQLLTVTWSGHFARFGERIHNVDRRLLVYATYLGAKYKELEDELREPRARGALIKCPACGFVSGVIDNLEVRISMFACLVCHAEAAAGRFLCSQWHALDGPPKECSCFEIHSRQQLLDELDPASLMSPEEQADAGQTLYSCGVCLAQQTVVPVEDLDGSDMHACVGCGAQFKGAVGGHCARCYELWMSYDTEGSELHGCPLCSGRYGDD